MLCLQEQILGMRLILFMESLTANPARQRTRRERRGCSSRIGWAGSLSLGRWADYTYGC